MTTEIHRVVLVVAVTFAAACGSAQVRPFPSRAPMWRDPDTTPFAGRPAKYVAAEVWDTVDNTVFAPAVDALAIDRPGRARNVNALDEVPDSSWFTNRIDTVHDDVDAIVRGACVDADPDPSGPWTVVGGKPNGANPGFMVKHADGRTFMFKPDVGTERQSAADFISTRLYFAAGYNTACARIAYLDAATFELSPAATTKDFVGDEVPFTQAMVDKALAGSIRDADGRVRGELSQFIEGTPLGPWKDFGTRGDDPNDVIPHEHRRELRGSYVLGALLGHYDAREQNSMDSWIETGDGEGYLRHYMFDFGDCLGSMSSRPRVSRRRGHAYELEWGVAFVELVTFGALDRPWRDADYGPGGRTLGYYTDEPFDPGNYRTAYPFGPYSRLTEADGAWGARILARISPAAIHALVEHARLTDPVVVRELERTLLGRREALLRRYLGTLSPLTRPTIDARGNLCVADARRDGGVLPAAAAITAEPVLGLGEHAALTVTGGCVAVLADPAKTAYVVIEMTAAGTRPLKIHLYAEGGRYRVAGVDR